MKVADDVADTAKAVDNAGSTVNAVGKTTEIQKTTAFGELIQTQKLNLEEVPIQRVSLPYKDYHNINDLFWVE